MGKAQRESRLETYDRIAKHFASLFNPASTERTRRPSERALAQWLTFSADPFARSDLVPGGARVGDDFATLAKAFVSSIRERASALGLPDSVVTAAVVIWSDQAQFRGRRQRRRGQFAEARQTAERLMAVARQFAHDFPDRTDSYLVLSAAHCQTSKNAWEHVDYAAIEQSLKQAVEAANHAVNLDPGREDARRLADRLTIRLAGLKAGRDQVRKSFCQAPSNLSLSK